MLCDECHKRPVVMKFQFMNQGQTMERSLCQICGQRYGGMLAPPVPSPAPFALLGGMLAPAHGSSTLPGPSRCAHCGYTFHQFQHTSMLGCAECYNAFSPQMEIILRRAQGGTVQHAGKTPARTGTTFKQRRVIEGLRVDLDRAVKEQRFEDAARLRDEIRALEKELTDDAAPR